MAINFPSSPTPGDIYSYNGYIWEYVSGGYWKSVTESDYIYSATTVGNGTSVISGITGGNLYLKSFSGNNISISESNGTLVFSASSTVSSLNVSDGISGNSTTGAVSIVNTDKGSSQNIFKNIQAGGINQFSAGSNNSNLNFSGINITITSAATNT